jgi:hypothetical protein
LCALAILSSDLAVDIVPGRDGKFLFSIFMTTQQKTPFVPGCKAMIKKDGVIISDGGYNLGCSTRTDVSDKKVVFIINGPQRPS